MLTTVVIVLFLAGTTSSIVPIQSAQATNANFYIMKSSSTPVDAGMSHLSPIKASCNSGDTATGGGYESSDKIIVSANNVLPDDTGWFIEVSNPTDHTIYVAATVICAHQQAPVDTNFYIIHSPATPIDAGATTLSPITVSCNTGDRPTGGGYESHEKTFVFNNDITASHTGWFIKVYNPINYEIRAAATVICAHQQAPAATNFYIGQSPPTTVVAGATTTSPITARCNSGEMAVGGGYTYQNNLPSGNQNFVFPNTILPNGTGWFIEVSNPTGGVTSAAATVICVNQQAIPEFPFALPMLVISLASLIIFYRIKNSVF
ncbi:MAG: hypothetical protein E6K91_07910 [Thaumarchaeota archaeon]|nr:MAG: hypothetical protein E6K91_07910 [Nitrososphaerota archaeon]